MVAHHRNAGETVRNACGGVLLGAFLALALPASAADLLPGEFGDIDLGRELLAPQRFPTINELRALVRKPEISTVLMIRLFDNKDNHHLPIYSEDGRRLALQRSDVQATTSRVLLFLSLADREPRLLSAAADCYDYMFRWGVNGPDCFTFVRLERQGVGTQVFFSLAGGEPQQRTPSTGRHRFPSLYRRTDGIWRLLYDHDGQLMHQSWNAEGPIDAPTPLLRGTAPRWARDGQRVLLARERSGVGGQYEMIVWNLRTEKEEVLTSGDFPIVRSPAWSPTEDAAACYVRQSGEGKPWQIRVFALGAGGPGRSLGANVVVNQKFESEGPAWEPSGRRIWYFSHDQRTQAYYPLMAADVGGGEPIVVHYPSQCTTPADLTFNPASAAVPELAVVGHVGAPQGLFVLFLNHF